MANTIESNTGIQRTGTLTTWTLDPAHTAVTFSAKHMMITTVRGSFAKVEGIIHLDEQDFTNSEVEATLDATSIVSGVEYRDNHLRSADFLHAEQYPQITFKSTRIERKRGDDYTVYGDLTIRGVAREVALDTTYEGRGKGIDGKEHMGFTAKTTINRKDWGLGWNVALETGGVLVGETIKIELDVQAVKADEVQEA